MPPDVQLPLLAGAPWGDLARRSPPSSIGFTLLAAAAIMFSPRFGRIMRCPRLGMHEDRRASAFASPRFRAVSAKRALRNKEWMLLLRDPWLISQTLMQILLLPPWLLLWRSLKARGALLVWCRF